MTWHKIKNLLVNADTLKRLKCPDLNFQLFTRQGKGILYIISTGVNQTKAVMALVLVGLWPLKVFLCNCAYRQQIAMSEHFCLFVCKAGLFKLFCARFVLCIKAYSCIGLLPSEPLIGLLAYSERNPRQYFPIVT